MVRLAALYVAVTAFVQAARYLKRFYVRRFANNVNRSMKRVLYGNLLHTSREELERAGTGNLMTRAISDVDACVEGMRKFTTEVFDTGVALAAYFVLLLVYDWRLALLTGLFPPVAFFLAERMKKPVSRCAAVYKESAGRLNGATLERISGAVTYRVFGLEADRDRAYGECLADYEKKAAAANLWENTLPPLYQVVSMLGAVLILCLSTVYTLRGNDKQEICKNVAAMKKEGDQLIFTDILGVPTAVTGTIEKIDLMDNLIFVRQN